MHSFSYERRAQWSDCDPSGIVFFAQYARWISDGLIEMFLALGVDPAAADPVGEDGETAGSMPSIGFSLRFLAPVKLHEIITHEVRVTKLGRSSLEFGHRILNGEGQCLVEGEEKRVWIDRDPATGTMKSRPIPDHVRTLLSGSVQAASLSDERKGAVL